MTLNSEMVLTEPQLVTSPYENLEHPDHPLHNDTVSNPKLLALILKGTPLLTGAAIASGCFYVGINNPESKTIFPTCGFYYVTGFYCPGCGMTRALHNLVGGNIIRAMRFNLILVLSVPFLLYGYIWWTNWAFTGKEMPRMKFPKSLLWAIGIFSLVFIIGRNMPGAIPTFFSLGR